MKEPRGNEKDRVIAKCKCSRLTDTAPSFHSKRVEVLNKQIKTTGGTMTSVKCGKSA